MRNQIMRNQNKEIALEVPEYFTGRLLVLVEKGGRVSYSKIRPNEILCSLDGFLEVAKLFGYTVTPHAGIKS